MKHNVAVSRQQLNGISRQLRRDTESTKTLCQPKIVKQRDEVPASWDHQHECSTALQSNRSHRFSPKVTVRLPTIQNIAKLRPTYGEHFIVRNLFFEHVVLRNFLRKQHRHGLVDLVQRSTGNAKVNAGLLHPMHDVVQQPLGGRESRL